MNLENSKNTSSLILFLEFLSKIEVRKLRFNDTETIFKFNQIFWKLLQHKTENVRILSAKCLTLFHEFRLGIPKIIENILEILFIIKNENFIYGLIKSLLFMIKKYESDIRSIELNGLEIFLNLIQKLIYDNYKKSKQFYSFYLRCHFLELFDYLKFNLMENFILEIIFGRENIKLEEEFDEILKNDENKTEIGYDIWFERVNFCYSRYLNKN